MLRIIFCLSLVFISTGCQEGDKATREIDQKNKKTEQVGIAQLDYEIIENEDISYAGTKRVKCRVILNEEELPNKEQMRRTAEAIWRDDEEKWSRLSIFIYMPEMDTAGNAYGIAEFERSGLTDFRIQDFTLYGTKWRSLEEELQHSDEEWKKAKQTEEVEEYNISLEISNARSSQIEIDIDTNFPDGTTFLVNVKRDSHHKDNSEIYAGEIFGRDMIVKNGKIKLSVDINDIGWYSEFQQKKSNLRGLVYSQIS